MTTKNKYWVSVWNLEKVWANSEEEAVRRITEEFRGGWYSARDFEYDDVALWEEEVWNPSLMKEWNLYKSGAPTPNQDTHCPDRTDDDSDDKEFFVTIIGSVVVEAEDEEQAEAEAYDVFPYIDRADFEIHVSEVTA